MRFYAKRDQKNTLKSIYLNQVGFCVICSPRMNIIINQVAVPTVPTSHAQAWVPTVLLPRLDTYSQPITTTRGLVFIQARDLTVPATQLQWWVLCTQWTLPPPDNITQYVALGGYYARHVSALVQLPLVWNAANIFSFIIIKGWF